MTAILGRRPRRPRPCSPSWLWLMRRDPRALPLLAIFALPFRLPISADGRTVNLLIPLTSS